MDYSTGFGAGSAGSSTWNAINQLSLVFAEGMNMLVGGPSSSKSEPRRTAKLKFGARFKKEVKPWAAKTPSVFTIKERPISSPSMARLPVDSFKEVVTSLSHNSNPSPANRVPIPQPSLVKNKKHLARSLAPSTSHKCAAPLGVVGSDKKSSSPPLTHSLVPRSEPIQPSHVAFEFSATANAETDLPVVSEND